MKHSEFTEKFHWMNGLSEYFRYTGQEHKYEPIFKALYHSNYYRKRDILVQLITRERLQFDSASEEIVKAWVNMLLNEHFDDIEVKPELITSLLSLYSNDVFVERIIRFISYFTFEHSTDLLLPDLGDFLSRGQVKSKLWMVDELEKVVDGPLGNVVFYGGWYNFMAHFLFSMFDVNKIYSIDLDSGLVGPLMCLYENEIANNKFSSISSDVNKIAWDGNKFKIIDRNRDIERSDIANIIINTSCEHMPNDWFHNLPDGTFVVLQTNDYFSNPQHSNCCENLEAAKAKYPMQNFMYAGELDTQLYNRFMLIGIK